MFTDTGVDFHGENDDENEENESTGNNLHQGMSMSKYTDIVSYMTC